MRTDYNQTEDTRTTRAEATITIGLADGAARGCRRATARAAASVDLDGAIYDLESRHVQHRQAATPKGTCSVPLTRRPTRRDPLRITPVYHPLDGAPLVLEPLLDEQRAVAH